VTVSVSDPAGLNDPLTYSFDWDTDGVYDLLNQSSPVASHIYTATGVYTMTVRVSDGDGGLTTQTFTVTVVTRDRPIVGLQVTHSAPTPVGNMTIFTATVISGTNVIYQWNFGDSVLNSGSLITHIYSATGIYTVFVTATNGANSVTTTVLVTVTTPPIYRTYLPVIVKAGAPDLVGSLRLSPNRTTFTAGEPVTITVIITNQGTAPSGPFWIDFFINPSTPPTRANTIWNSVCSLSPCFGIAWFVPIQLQPGQSITMTSAANGYATDYSYWLGWFANGTTDLYLYIDSWNPPLDTGAVLESNETNNRAEMHGLTVTGNNPAQNQSVNEPIPLRPTR
jgi:PKD repeat protein